MRNVTLIVFSLIMAALPLQADIFEIRVPAGTPDPLIVAQEKAEELKGTVSRDDEILIRLEAGLYPCRKTVRWNSDSLPPCRVTILTVSGTAVFDYGIPISGWTEGQTSDGLRLWSTDLSRQEVTPPRFEQLFSEGTIRPNASLPDSGFFTFKGVDEKAVESTSPDEAVQRLKVDPEVSDLLTSLTPQDRKEVLMTAYHKWDCTFRRNLSVVGDEIVTLGKRMKPWNPLFSGGRFKLSNLPRGLTLPGEWYLSAEGKLYYLPLPGESISKSRFSIPSVEHALQLDGVENLSLINIEFLHTGLTLGLDGMEPAQAAAPVDAVITADRSSNILIKNCRIAGNGRYGIWFRESCFDSEVRDSLIEESGAGGIRIGTTKRLQISPDEEAQVRAASTSRIRLENNIIRRGGRVLPPAVGVLVGHASHSTISRNTIEDFYYTGISVGWVWGYAPSIADHNIIAQNHIRLIGQGLLSDMAGIYTLGVSEGSVIRENLIEEVDAYSYGGWGLYTDEGSSYILMEGNVVKNTKTGSFHQHYGKENIIRNNVFINAKKYQIQATRVEQHLSFTLENNVVLWDRGILMEGPWRKIDCIIRGNRYYSPDLTHSSRAFDRRNLKGWNRRKNITNESRFELPEGTTYRQLLETGYWLKPDRVGAQR